MKKEQFLQLVGTYRQLLTHAGVSARSVDPRPHHSREETLGHCLWVLEHVIEPLLNRIGGIQEATRLLGCIQGTVMAYGLCTIAETRRHAADANLNTWDKILDLDDKCQLV